MELQELQGVVHNFETEIKWIAEGRDTKAQQLQAGMEEVWEELRLHSEMQSSIQQPQDQTQQLQGLELHQGSHIILHGLHNQEDLNGMVKTVGNFDDDKAQWVIKTRRGESIWVKGANLLPANSMEAKAILMENYKETRIKIEASKQ